MAMSRLTAWTCSGLLALILSMPLHGHAILLSAIPEANQTVSGPDVPFRLRFNSRIDAKRSRLILVAPDATQTPLEIGEQTSADTLTAAARGLKSGAYVLRWQVLAADGHITRGEFRLQVR
jgi:copper resistance protein C